MHCPINDHCTLVMVLSNIQSLFWIWASKLLLWRRFDFAFLGQKKKTEMGMVDFSFSSQKVWNLDVSISSRIMRFVCKISLSLLETRENIFGFLFSSRNWRKCLKFLHFFCKNSRSFLEPENRSRHFSFLFSKLEMWIPYFSFSSRFDFLASRRLVLAVSNNEIEIEYGSAVFPSRLRTGYDKVVRFKVEFLRTRKLWGNSLRLALANWARPETAF